MLPSERGRTDHVRREIHRHLEDSLEEVEHVEEPQDWSERRTTTNDNQEKHGYEKHRAPAKPAVC